MFSSKEIKEIIYGEIFDLAYEISITSCEGCTYNYGAQHGHSCLNPFFYNLSLEKAIEKVKKEYNIKDNLDFFYEKHHMRDY